VKRPARLALFASGGGTNLQALLDHFNATESGLARVELVVASRAGIGALARATRAGVSARTIDPTLLGTEATLAETLAALTAHRIDFIVLAGYLKLIHPSLVDRYHGRMVNIHPALLPAFGGAGMYGLRVHEAVLASGARVSGATVHLVGERYDEGSIIAQWPVPVLAGDTPELLAARVLRVEHLLLPAAIEGLIAGRDSDRTEPGSFLEPDQAFELVNKVLPATESLRRLNLRRHRRG
jgi:phosphoribosylglycinamide formyltransferase 1